MEQRAGRLKRDWKTWDHWSCPWLTLIKVTVRKRKKEKISGQNENISAQHICRGLIEFMINFTDFTPGGDISGIIKPPLSVAFFYSRPKKTPQASPNIQTHTRVQMSERHCLLSFSEQSTLHYCYLRIIPLFSIFTSSSSSPSSSSSWIPREFVHVSLCAPEARPAFFCCSTYCSPMEVDKDYRWLDAPLIPGL